MHPIVASRDRFGGCERYWQLNKYLPVSHGEMTSSRQAWKAFLGITVPGLLPLPVACQVNLFTTTTETRATQTNHFESKPPSRSTRERTSQTCTPPNYRGAYCTLKQQPHTPNQFSLSNTGNKSTTTRMKHLMNIRASITSTDPSPHGR